MGPREEKAPQLIPRREEGQLAQRLTDASDQLCQPLSALWLPPVHRDRLLLIRDDSPGSRHARKFNRNKRVFTATGWLILWFLGRDILWDSFQLTSCCPGWVTARKGTRSRCFGGRFYMTGNSEDCPVCLRRNTMRTAFKIPSYFKSLFIWGEKKKNRPCLLDKRFVWDHCAFRGRLLCGIFVRGGPTCAPAVYGGFPCLLKTNPKSKPKAQGFLICGFPSSS